MGFGRKTGWISTWRHENYRRPDYLLILMALGLVLASLVTVLSALPYYHFILGAWLATISSLCMVLYCLVLTFFLLFSKRCRLIFALLAAGIFFYTITLILTLDERFRIVSVLWFAVVPIFLSFRFSAVEVLTSSVFCGVMVLFLWHYQEWIAFLLEGNNLPVYVKNDDLPYHALIVVEFFGLSLSFGVLLLMPLSIKSHEHSVYDHLTELYSCLLLEKDVSFLFEKFQNKGEVFFIGFIDLNYFKEVNDYFGHEVGDKLLKQLGARLSEYNHKLSSSYSMNIYRYGGDEFVFLLEGDLLESDINDFVSNILAVIEKPFDISGYKIDVSASLGLVKSSEQVSSAEELLKFADYTMYEEKFANKLNFQPYLGFGKASFNKWDHRFAIYQELYKQNFDEQFTVVYQPIYSVSKLEISKFEALIRWNSPVLGEVSPDEFIPIAEATGLICQLFDWLIQQVILSIDAWLVYKENLIISINFSPVQMRYPQHISQLLKDFNGKYYGYSSYLELEITETSPITNNRFIVEILKDFKKTKLNLTLDDYGQGSSSFISLRSGVFANIKLDKALFFEGFLDRRLVAVLSGIVHSAHSLGLKVTAEGVETESQLALVRDLGCEYAQGFLLSKPVNEVEVSLMLNGMGT